jgi:hypothetical protein
MSRPSSRRQVNLIDAHASGRPFVVAELYRDYPPAELDGIEAVWADAREAVATTGLAPMEHSHWDWRNKAESVEEGHHMLVAVECEGKVQGLMAVLRFPRLGLLGDEQVVYVDYLESAPWNLKSGATPPRFLGVGTILIADAVRISLETGLSGRVGLHSLPQAETFYSSRCRMTRVGPDPNYYDLTYFEYTAQQAKDWLAAIGESP